MKIEDVNALCVHNLSKSYGEVEVLHNVDFDLKKGEVHGICGENGAGKSTLIKVITGVVPFGQGVLKLFDKQFSSLTPTISKEYGVHAVYQENFLVPYMSVAENIFIGQEHSVWGGFISKKQTTEQARKLISRYGLKLDPTRMVHSISVAEQQYVKILKALEHRSEILILDEPTSMFNIKDANLVLDLVERIKDDGVSVIYISHHLQEVVKIADRISVLKDGHVVNCIDNSKRDADLSMIASSMVGRPINAFYKKKEKVKRGELVLEVKGLKRRRAMPSQSFSLYAGEILGIAGMVGSGRSEMARAIFGADFFDEGTVIFRGKKVCYSHPKKAIGDGIAMIPEDRQKQGLALSMSIGENLVMASIKKLANIFYKMKKLLRKQQSIIDYVNIKAQSPFTLAESLSGGNQQKTVIGKWLNTDADVYIMDEPTRGIDVNSKSEIYNIICDLAKKGKAILLISSDMPELIALSDRILVMRNNEFTAEFIGEECVEENIIVKMVGV